VVLLSPTGDLTVLTGEFVSACEPTVSFDGTKILFAGKHQQDEPYNIFEMSLDGSSTRQITNDLGDCREPLYLARASVTPPTFEDRVRWITFTSTAEGVLDELGNSPVTCLYATNIEPIKGRDTVLWQTSYNLGGDFSPTVLRDGRVLFSSNNKGQVKLMTITWAGDNLNLFLPAQEGIVQSMACELPEQRAVVFVESEAPNKGGQLAQLSLWRPLHSRSQLSKGQGLYRTPACMGDGELLVSYTSGQESYGVYLFDRDTGRAGELVYDDPDYDEVDAMPVRARTEPIARIPMLEFASVLDIEGFENAGQLHCMSIYDSDEEEVQRLEPGSVRWARFIQGIGVEQGQCPQQHPQEQTWPPPCVTTRVMGEAPVEPDGSFFVNIAGNVPFYIEILDKDKQVLHTMSSWMWVRSKSQRGCIGCHENKELAPQNRATDALLKMKPTFIGAAAHDPAQPQLMSSHRTTSQEAQRHE